MNPLRLLKNNIDALFAALVGMLLIIVFTTHGGVGISPDSIYYKSAADSLMKGKGFYQFDDSPLILFPLFYTSFLALVQFIFRQDVIVFAPYLNGVLFAVAIFISGCCASGWACYTRKSFGLMANSVFLVTIDSIGLLRYFLQH